MLNLSTPSDREKLEELILEDINQYCTELYEHGHRNHIGASELGKPCWRMLWYKFRWVKAVAPSGQILRLFNVGHTAEPRFISYLRGVGFEVKEFEPSILHYHPESGSYFRKPEFDPGDGLVENVTGLPYHETEAIAQGVKPNQFRISGAMGHYGGSLDGMCKAPSRYQLNEDLVFLNEFKTNNTGPAFAKLAKEGVQKAKPEHFAQMSQYGYKYGLKYGLYLIENKNDSDIVIKIVELDWNYGAQLEKKAEQIIFSKEPLPRISENPAAFECKYCDFVGICHNGEKVEKNCRSCRNAVPTIDASWTCSLHGLIPSEFIKVGCDNWLPI